MSKFLFLTDGHANGSNSINRIGNFWNDWMAKFSEMLEIASKSGCEAVLDGGDMLDTPEPSYRILDGIADKIEAYKIPVYSLIGNHGLKYRNLEVSRYTGMSHLFKRSSYFHYLEKIETKDFIIQGYEFSHHIEQEINENGIIFANVDDKWKIAIIHAMILDKPFFKDVPHCVCKDIKTNADLVLLGHYHHPFTVKTDTTEFLNVGCFGRGSIGEANIEPSVVLLDTDKRSYEIIKLTSAKPGHEIFDLTKYQDKKDGEKSIEEYLEAMGKIEIQGLDFQQQITKIGKELKTEQKVIDYLLAKKEEIENEQ